MIIAAAALLALVSCSPRVSYNVRTLHADPKFSGRMLGEAEVVLLPLLSSGGAVATDGFEADGMVALLRGMRPDIKWVSYEKFEDGFPAIFDRRAFADFYRGIFDEDILSVKGMDSIWAHVRQPFILAFSIVDGAGIRNLDDSKFKHVTIRCELWSKSERAVVLRTICKVVSDDAFFSDMRLIKECMRRLVDAIPGTMPNYGHEDW